MEVYNLATYVALNDCTTKGREALFACIDATPTDGLGITSSDVEQLGAKNYEEVDDILKAHFYDNTNFTDHPVIKRHYASAFKRTDPYNLPRDIVCAGAI
jgi:hypothetical protein